MGKYSFYCHNCYKKTNNSDAAEQLKNAKLCNECVGKGLHLKEKLMIIVVRNETK
jgi:NAD-dependent SIR2 family protein deacetylase